MSKVRFIVVVLICAMPAILLWDGLVIQGLIAGIIAVALAITARTLRPGEIGFLISTIWPVVVVAAVPALWILTQILPLGVLANPIWSSLETALGHPVEGAISVNPGASIIALGQYLTVAAIGFVSAAISVDRHRAEWILFALTGTSTAIALMLLAQELGQPASRFAALTHAQATDCVGIGTIIACAACVRTIERYETRHTNPLRSVPTLRRTFAASSVALTICVAAFVLNGTHEVLVATGFGIAAFACVMLIRRFRLGFWYASITAAMIGVFVLLVAPHQAERERSLLLAFAASPTAVSQRVLDDAPLMGTGAGTFATLAPVYREMDDPPPGSVASTTSATFAIELGRPMIWLIFAAMVGFIIMLLRASLQRGRDSFYPAMGGSCLITLMVLSLINAGLLATPTCVIAAATLGLAFAQSKSRMVKA